MINSRYLRSVCKGVSGALILCLSGFTLLSVFIEKFDIGREIYNMVYICIALISLSAGSIVAAKKNGCKGWFTGLGVAVGYYFILLIASIFIIEGFSFEFGDLLKFIGVVFIGIISGILGINM